MTHLPRRRRDTGNRSSPSATTLLAVVTFLTLAVIVTVLVAAGE